MLPLDHGPSYEWVYNGFCQLFFSSNYIEWWAGQDFQSALNLRYPPFPRETCGFKPIESLRLSRFLGLLFPLLSINPCKGGVYYFFLNRWTTGPNYGAEDGIRTHGPFRELALDHQRVLGYPCDHTDVSRLAPYHLATSALTAGRPKVVILNLIVYA